MSKRNIISKGISRDQRRSIKNQLIRFGKDVTNRFIGIQNNDNRISRSDFLNINNSFNNIPGNAINLKHTSNIEILGIENNKENDFDNTNNIDVFDSKNRENFIENNEDIIEDCEDNYFDNEDSIPDHIRQLYYDNYENAHNNGKPLFKGTNKTTAQFLARFLSLKLKSQVSDNTAEKFSKLFCDFLPENHTCPRTLKGIRNELAFSVPDVSNIFENTNEHVYDNGRLLKFPFMDLIKLIITCNLKYFLRNYNGETKTLNLLLHTDGAPLSKSSKVQMWPMSGIFLDLPPKVRIAFHNIVIFSIWLTNQSENFNIICNELRSELKNKVYAVKGSNQNKDINFYYRINIESITRDIPALRKANNLTGCNGSYGCTYCFHKGAYAKTGSGAGNGKMVFNNAKDMSLRTSSKYERFAKMLDNNPSQVMFGMKGRSHLEGIVNVPEGIMIDYMHTVLLGLIKEDMTTIRDGDKKIFANNYKIPKLKESTIMFSITH
uniref:DUF4806 domain-containing protein n=1 Tax=Strongyloides venezuelensis TaxID=75913 RepID=A0A0K0EWR3_STRVS